jgi:ribose transport system ATP-binding protein
VAAIQPPGTPVLELRNLSKSFAGNAALVDVSLRIETSQVHGLLGHNGSGKSTLIKVLAGYHVPERGSELEVHGVPEELPLAPGRAAELGLAFVHQDLALIPTVTVLENLRIPLWGTKRGRVRWRSERKQARADLRALGLDVDVDRSIGTLNKGERALIAVARAASEMGLTRDDEAETGRSGVLVLDEPTVFLSRAGRDRLFELIRHVARLGAGVLFVSHDLDEVLSNTDVVTVLRDGRVAGQRRTAETTRRELIHLIVGRHAVAEAPSTVSAIARKPLAQVRLRSGGSTQLVGVEFDLQAGEILGATGLLGSGFDELPYLLFGAGPAGVEGDLVLGERRIDLSQLRPAAALRFGLGLIPSNRARDGGILTLPVADNVMMLSLPEVTRYGRVSGRRLVTTAASDMNRFDVLPRVPSLAYGRLSGGNQQKALVAKWLRIRPKLLLLDEPTQGVDVGARQEIIGQLRQLCEAGGGVLYCSSDHAELSQVCDRVLIFYQGRLTRILSGDELTKEHITEATIGSEPLTGVLQ